MTSAIKTIYRVPRLRIALVRETPHVDFPAYALRTSGEVYQALAPLFADADRECFWVVPLDGKNRPIGVNRVSEGTLTSALVHPREVFKPLVLANAAAAVLVHGHPSGDPTPSAEDIAITRRLREVGDLMGIAILDHLVIGDGRYVELRGRGDLNTNPPTDGREADASRAFVFRRTIHGQQDRSHHHRSPALPRGHHAQHARARTGAPAAPPRHSASHPARARAPPKEG